MLFAVLFGSVCLMIAGMLAWIGWDAKYNWNGDHKLTGEERAVLGTKSLLVNNPWMESLFLEQGLL